MFTHQLLQIFEGKPVYRRVNRKNPFSGKLIAKYRRFWPNIGNGQNKTPATKAAAGIRNLVNSIGGEAYESSTGASTSDAAGTMLPSSFSRAMFSTCSGFCSLSLRMASRQAGESGARRTIYST